MPGLGLYGKSKTRNGDPTARPAGSIPFGATMSRPASTLFPVVVLTPSVIHPRLSKAGSSLINVKRVRGIGAPCIPEPGEALLGESGVGLSSLYIEYVAVCVWSLVMFFRHRSSPPFSASTKV